MGRDASTFNRDAIEANLAGIRDGVRIACERSGRDPARVRLVAAAKTVPPEPIRWVVEAGCPDIGQNYVKELARTRDEIPTARWHFIGNLQTSTAHKVGELADVVQTLASDRATQRLARRAAEHDRVLDALIEVDFTNGRSGLAPQDVAAFADRVAPLEGLRLVGLMTLPPIPEIPEEARPWFRRLHDLGEELRREHPGMVELSMGMSKDYQVAVEEGATMVRIGTTLFGERPHRH
ncbi:MAG: YggS family pyridoxal phosphate-dependent enzyme [Actinomycetota bacterium]